MLTLIRDGLKCEKIVEILYAPVAQWIEHPPPKGRVTRSIRVGGTKYSR